LPANPEERSLRPQAALKGSNKQPSSNLDQNKLAGLILDLIV
jgi:hypothetical protein